MPPVNQKARQTGVREEPAQWGRLVLRIERFLQQAESIGKPSETSLADLFRKWQQMLSAGLRIDRAVASTLPKYPGPLRRPLQHVLQELRAGVELGESLRQTGVFPPLVVELVTAGEAAGALAEVCGFLADHYDLRVRNRRRLIQRLTWPIMQLTMAVLILTVLILALGIIAEIRGGEPIDVLGLGLYGPKGAMIFLSSVTGIAVGGWLAYWFLTRWFSRKVQVHRLLLQVPVIRAVKQNLSLARFCWALHLTSETGRRIDQATVLSLRATNNPAFAAVTKPVAQALREGNELTPTLAATGLFPSDFLEQTQVAELTGTLPETMQRLANLYWEQGEHALSRALWVVSILVWMGVATLIIVAIFRIFFFYLNLIQSHMP